MTEKDGLGHFCLGDLVLIYAWNVGIICGIIKFVNSYIHVSLTFSTSKDFFRCRNDFFHNHFKISAKVFTSLLGI